jgi:hypothetical protein
VDGTRGKLRFRSAFMLMVDLIPSLFLCSAGRKVLETPDGVLNPRGITLVLLLSLILKHTQIEITLRTGRDSSTNRGRHTLLLTTSLDVK